MDRSSIGQFLVKIVYKSNGPRCDGRRLVQAFLWISDTAPLVSQRTTGYLVDHLHQALTLHRADVFVIFVFFQSDSTRKTSVLSNNTPSRTKSARNVSQSLVWVLHQRHCTARHIGQELLHFVSRRMLSFKMQGIMENDYKTEDER